MANELKVYSGNSNTALTEEICRYLGVAQGKVEVGRFPEGEVKVKICESVRGMDCFIVQPTCPPVNESLMELLVMMDACRRASPRRLTAVIPYYGYGRQDRKDQPRVPVTAKLVANLITKAGADRVLAMDLHALQIQGFFDIPLDHLLAMPVLVEHFNGLQIPDLVVCTADLGGVKAAWKFAERLNAPLAIVDKKRSSDTKVEAQVLIGDVRGKNVVIPDDMIATAGTICEAAKFLKKNGARDIHVCCTHPVLSGKAVENLAGAEFKSIVVTNTIPLREEAKKLNIVQLSIASIFGEAIKRIHNETSVSTLFE